MIELDTDAIRTPDLHNFFYECPSCGQDLRIDFYDQIRVCQCGQVIQLSEDYQDFLRQEKADLQRKIRLRDEQMGDPEV